MRQPPFTARIKKDSHSACDGDCCGMKYEVISIDPSNETRYLGYVKNENDEFKCGKETCYFHYDELENFSTNKELL